MQNIETFGKLFDLLQAFDNDQDEYKERMAKKSNIINPLKIKNKSPNKNLPNETVQKGDNNKGKFYQQEKIAKNR